MTEKDIREFIAPVKEDLDAAIILLHHYDGDTKSYLLGQTPEKLIALLVILMINIEKLSGCSFAEQIDILKAANDGRDKNVN